MCVCVCVRACVSRPKCTNLYVCHLEVRVPSLCFWPKGMVKRLSVENMHPSILELIKITTT